MNAAAPLLVATDGSGLDGRKGYGYCISATEYGYGPVPSDGHAELEAVAAVLHDHPEPATLDLVTDSHEVALRIGLFQPPKRSTPSVDRVMALTAARPGLSVRRVDPRTGEVAQQSVAHVLAYIGRQVPDYDPERVAALVRTVLASDDPHAEAKRLVFGLPYYSASLGAVVEPQTT